MKNIIDDLETMSEGVIIGGPYMGNNWQLPIPSGFPRWWSVEILFPDGRRARRDVQEQYLAESS